MPDFAPSLERSLQWVTDRLFCFDPLPGGKADKRGLKAFGELSILYLYACEVNPSCAERASLLPFARECGRFLHSCCARPEFAEVARREPLLGYLCVLPYMALRATDIRVAALEETLQWLSRFNLPCSVETVPYRELDRQYFLWKGGMTPRQRSWNKLLTNTVLGSRRGTLHFDREEAYSVTHALIYITDFGKKPDALSPRVRARTERLLESLIVHYWRLGNWDLLGELLMSVHLLRLPAGPLVGAASTALAEELDNDGSLPASSLERRQERRRRYAASKEHVAVESYTARRYHPTFVWILFSLARLNAREEHS